MANLGIKVIRMKTVLPTKKVFYIIVNYVAQINYYSWWKAGTITLEDQVFIGMTQNYTNLHLALLFSCSVTATVATIGNGC